MPNTKKILHTNTNGPKLKQINDRKMIITKKYCNEKDNVSAPMQQRSAHEEQKPNFFDGQTGDRSPAK